MSPHFTSAKLVSIEYGRSQTTLSMASDEETFELKSESRMFRDLAIGTSLTIAVNNEGDVIAIHVDSETRTIR